MQTLRNTGAILTLAVASLSGTGCDQKQAPEQPASAGHNESDPQIKQWRERGYVDAGEGIFLIPESRGRSVEGDIKFAQALSNFRADHPDLEIVHQFTIDGDSEFGGANKIEWTRDGLVLWTQNKEFKK